MKVNQNKNIYMLMNWINLYLLLEADNLSVSTYWTLWRQRPFSSLLSPCSKPLLTRLKSVIDFTSLISSLYYEELSPLHLGPLRCLFSYLPLSALAPPSGGCANPHLPDSLCTHTHTHTHKHSWENPRSRQSARQCLEQPASNVKQRQMEEKQNQTQK